MTAPSSVSPVVLLAEDDDSYRVLCRLTFERAGFRVVEARDGAEAIERALESRPAAIVLDLWLPELTGREVIRVLRTNETFAGVPIVVVSGVPEAKDVEGLLSDGADQVLEKPVPPPDVVAAIAELLRDGRRPGTRDHRRLERSGG